MGYTYDQRANGKGHLTGISDLSGTTDLDYNGRGRLTAKTVTISNMPFAMHRILTPGGRAMQIAYPGGRTVDYTRNQCPCEISGISATGGSIN